MNRSTRLRVPVVSLFCGPGGMDLGFERVGFDVVYATDKDPDAVRTHNRNRRVKSANVCDLLNLSADELCTKVRAAIPGVMPRGIIGGPPCQSFSVANVAKKKWDPRGRLLTKYAELLNLFSQEFPLDFFVLENVLGLRSRHRHYFNKVLRLFRQAGFDVFAREIDAAQFGVAQTRRRLFVVGLNRHRFPLVRFLFPEGNGDRRTVRDVLNGLPDPVFFSRPLRPSQYHFIQITGR